MVLSYLLVRVLTSKIAVCAGFYSVADVNIGLHPRVYQCTMPHPHPRSITIFISHES